MLIPGLQILVKSIRTEALLGYLSERLIVEMLIQLEVEKGTEKLELSVMNKTG